MGKKPIPEEITPRGASGKPSDYNDISRRRKSLRRIKRCILTSFSPFIRDAPAVPHIGGDARFGQKRRADAAAA
jgi:hypothetical protein